MAEDALVSGTVKLPGVGPVKKVYLYVGVGAVGVLAAYLMWSRQKAASEAAPEYTDAELGDGLTTGPGSDVYQGANAGGSGSDDGSDIEPMPKTNTEWTSQVVEYFNWVEPGYVTAVVGKYLAKVPLSLEEADFIRQTWAAKGKPPDGPSNFVLTSDTNTPGTGTTPSVPAGVHVTGSTETSITLDWTDSADATGYRVFRNGAQVGTPTASTFTDTGLATSTAYSYTVRATAGTKESADSPALSAKTNGPAAQTGPIIKGLNLAGSATTSLRFAWGFDPSAPKPDRVEMFLNDKPVSNYPGAPTTYTFTGLKKGTRYKISVRGGKGNVVGPTASSYGTTRK